MAVNFDVIAGLCNVDTIEHVKKTLTFKWDREVVVYHVKENVSRTFVGRSNGKIVNLAFEDNTLIFNDIQIQAGFVDGGKLRSNVQ